MQCHGCMTPHSATDEPTDPRSAGFDEQGQNRQPDPSFVPDATDPLLWQRDLEGPGTQQHRFNRGQHASTAPEVKVPAPVEGAHGGRYGQGGYDTGSHQVPTAARSAKADDSVLQLIIEQLWLSRIESAEVDISVGNGAVTLSGTVPDRLARWELERLVRGLPGVVSVQCLVQVDHLEPRPYDRRTSFGPLDPRP